jgi:ADYC domain
MTVRNRVVAGMVVARAVAVAFGMAVTSCGIDVEPTTVVTAALASDCGIWGCASNAATMAHELDASSQHANDVGLTFVSFIAPGPGGDALRVDVVGDELRGVRLRDQTILTGDALLGAVMTVKDQQGARSQIRLDAEGVTDYWPVPTPGKTKTYVFQYREEHASDWRNLCSDPIPPKGEDPPAWTHEPDWAWVGRPIAVVFSGDRYDNKLLTVSTGNIGRWFNIACAGSAVAKMHLLRYTTASGQAAPVPSDSQRTAVLKMITDDICGTGHSFTVDGEAVLYDDWLNHHGYAFGRGTERSAEAIWTERGAACLWEPRRRMEDPAIWDKIDHVCARPRNCTDDDVQVFWAQSEPRLGWGYSANP